MARLWYLDHRLLWTLALQPHNLLHWQVLDVTPGDRAAVRAATMLLRVVQLLLKVGVLAREALHRDVEIVERVGDLLDGGLLAG